MSLVATLAVIFGSLAVGSPASASSVQYAPTKGRVTTSHNGDWLHITVAFRLSRYQLDVLRDTGQYMELSYYVYGVTIAGNSPNYAIYSNLPNATHDVGFHDSTFSPGITGIPTSQLQANTPYYGTVEFNSRTKGTPRVVVGFSPSHFSMGGDLSDPMEDIIEAGACKVGNDTLAWCVFPTDTAFLTANYGGSVPVVNGGAYTLDPGRLDLANMG
jgi:hypothetical protein